MSTKKTEDTWPKTVRTTMQPDTDLEVTEREHTELAVQGLLVENKENK